MVGRGIGYLRRHELARTGGERLSDDELDDIEEEFDSNNALKVEGDGNNTSNVATNASDVQASRASCLVLTKPRHWVSMSRTSQVPHCRQALTRSRVASVEPESTMTSWDARARIESRTRPMVR